MSTQLMQENVSDFGAAKAKAALERIAAAEAMAGDAVKRTREDWLEYGVQLLAARDRLPGTKSFGQWIKDNGLDTGVAKGKQVRSDAIWMAERTSELHTCNSRNHHPTHLRSECRKAGYEWAIPKPKLKAPSRADKAHSEVMAELADLPETTKAKFERLVAKEMKALQARFSQDLQQAVKQQVDEQLAVQRKFYEDGAARNAYLSNELSVRSKTLDQWMTQEEFRLVLGCLHPDKQPADAHARYSRAFQIFKRLEERLEADGRVLRGREW